MLSEEFECPHCSELFKDQGQLANHKREYHSSKCRVWIYNDQGIKESIDLKRTQECFICPVCNKPVQTRDGVIKHTNGHLNDKDNGSEFLCIKCGESFKSAKDLDQHSDTHSQPQEVLETDDLGNTDVLKQAKAELDLATKNPAFSDCFLDVLAPFPCVHESGLRSV